MGTGTNTLGKELIALDSLRTGLAVIGFALMAMFGPGAANFLAFAFASRFEDRESELVEGFLFWVQRLSTWTWALGLLGLALGTWILARRPRGPLPGPSRYAYAVLVAGELLLILAYGPLLGTSTNRITEGAVGALYEIVPTLERVLSLAYPIAVAFLLACLLVFTLRRGRQGVALGWAALLGGSCVTWIVSEGLVMGREPASAFSLELALGLGLALLAVASPVLALVTARSVWLEAIERPTAHP